MDSIVTERLAGAARALDPQEQKPRDPPRKGRRRPPRPRPEEDSIENVETTPHKVDSLA